MAKLTYSQISAELRETSKVSMDVKGSYSYATGTYESIISELVANLPAHKQQEVVRILQSARLRMQEGA